MNPTVSDTIGKDAVIEYVKNQLYTKLMALWFPDENPATSKKLYAYPRCYRKEDDKKKTITIEHFKGGVSYQNMIYTQENKFWFYMPKAETRRPGTIDDYEAKIELYFTLNLTSVKPSITNRRADGDVHADVENILNEIYIIRPMETITEIQNVYKGFSYTQGDDLHPKHCFKIILHAYDFKTDLEYCSI